MVLAFGPAGRRFQFDGRTIPRSDSSPQREIAGVHVGARSFVAPQDPGSGHGRSGGAHRPLAGCSVQRPTLARLDGLEAHVEEPLGLGQAVQEHRRRKQQGFPGQTLQQAPVHLQRADRMDGTRALAKQHRQHQSPDARQFDLLEPANVGSQGLVVEKDHHQGVDRRRIDVMRNDLDERPTGRSERGPPCRLHGNSPIVEWEYANEVGAARIPPGRVEA